MSDWTGSSKQRKEYNGGGIAVSNKPVKLKPKVEDLPDSPRKPLTPLPPPKSQPIYVIKAGTKVLRLKLNDQDGKFGGWKHHILEYDILITNCVREDKYKGYKKFRINGYDTICYINHLIDLKDYTNG